MKRILTVLAIAALSVQFAFAQDFAKNVEKAKAASQDAKKAEKVATWLNLGKAYMSAYQAPTSNVPNMGMTSAELQILMGNDKPKSIENVTLGGQAFEKQIFKDKDLYFQSGRLSYINVTKPVLGEEDALDGAFKAYEKAGEIDVKKTKIKEVSAKIDEIDKAYFNDAYTAYVLGDKKKAADLFLKAGNVSVSQFSPRIDTSAFFNAGLAAGESGDLDMALDCYNRSLEYGYDKISEGGVYSSISNVYMKQKDTLAAKKALEDGFAQYPGNQQIMIDLINLYLVTKGNPEDIILLLQKAKEQMPDVAGLYDVEGDIWKQLGNRDKALAAYQQSLAINPKGDYPYYAQGLLYIDWYNQIDAEKAQVDLRDYKKYDQLDALGKETLAKSIEPLEKCYEVTTRKEMKLGAADYLKKVYFQLRNVKPEYMDLHKKYDEICKQLQAQ